MAKASELITIDFLVLYLLTPPVTQLFCVAFLKNWLFYIKPWAMNIESGLYYFF